MYLSINFDFFSSFSKFILKSIPKNLIFFFVFKLSNSKFAKDLKKTQTKTQQIENPNPDLTFGFYWVHMSAYN